MRVWKFSIRTVQEIGGTKLQNKLVVLTSEWLQTSWRDSGYDRFAFGMEDY